MKKIPKGEWENFSVPTDSLIYNDCFWWNMKWYDWPDKNRELDGNLPQQSAYGTEVPYGRKFGHPSRGRFASNQSCEVSYWTNNYDLAVEETKQKNQNQYGIPAQRSLKNGASILKLDDEQCAFLLSLEKYEMVDNPTLFFEKLCELGKDVYPITHAIADLAYQHGFKGMLYKSSKADAIPGKMDKVAVQFNCLVLYQEDAILECQYEGTG